MAQAKEAEIEIEAWDESTVPRLSEELLAPTRVAAPRRPRPRVAPREPQWSDLTVRQRQRWVDDAWAKRFADDPRAVGPRPRANLTKSGVHLVLDALSAGRRPPGIPTEQVALVMEVAAESGLGWSSVRERVVRVPTPAGPGWEDGYRLRGGREARSLALAVAALLGVGILLILGPPLGLLPAAAFSVPAGSLVGVLAVIAAFLLAMAAYHAELRLVPKEVTT